jgi:hypothetical protein
MYVSCEQAIVVSSIQNSKLHSCSPGIFFNLDDWRQYTFTSQLTLLDALLHCRWIFKQRSIDEDELHAVLCF